MKAKPETQITTLKRTSKLNNDCASRFKMIRNLYINYISSKLMVGGLFDVTIITETKLGDP